MNGVPLCDFVGLDGVLVLEDATRVDQAHSVCGSVAVFSNLVLEVEDSVGGLESDDILLVVGGLDVDGDFRHDDLLCVWLCGISVCKREEERRKKCTKTKSGMRSGESGGRGNEHVRGNKRKEKKKRGDGEEKREARTEKGKKGRKGKVGREKKKEERRNKKKRKCQERKRERENERSQNGTPTLCWLLAVGNRQMKGSAYAPLCPRALLLRFSFLLFPSF